MVKATSTIAKAAGLKMCFFPMAKMYFEAMAQMDAQIANGRNCAYTPPWAGVMRKNKIKEVM